MTPNQYEFADRLNNDDLLMGLVSEHYAQLVVSKMSPDELRQHVLHQVKTDCVQSGADLLVEDIVKDDPDWLTSEYGVVII